MPALVNACANVAMGGAFALIARRSAAMKEELLAWPLLFLLAFEGVCITPVATYLFRFYPQWSMLYWFDPQIFSGLEEWIGALGALAILINVGGAIGGYAAGREGIRSGRRWLTYLPVGVGGGGVLLLLWLFGHRVIYVGDYDAYWRGEADFFLLRAPGLIGTALYVAGAAFVRWLHLRFGQRDPSPW